MNTDIPQQQQPTETRIFLNKALLRTLCATVSMDETRAVINGIYFESIGSRLVCVCTNGRILAAVDVSDYRNALPDGPFSVIVPKPRLLPEKLESDGSVISGDEEELEMELRIVDGEARWRDYDGLEVVGQLIPGRFPDWRRVLACARDAEGEQVVPLMINPVYLAEAARVLTTWMSIKGIYDAVHVYPARGKLAGNAAVHVLRPANRQLSEDAVALVMPMRFKEEEEPRDAGPLISAWWFAQGWRPISSAPRTAKSFQAIMKDGTVHPDVHWASNPHGEEQPPFEGFFIPAAGGGFQDIGIPLGWRPLDLPAWTE